MLSAQHSSRRPLSTTLSSSAKQTQRSRLIVNEGLGPFGRPASQYSYLASERTPHTEAPILSILPRILPTTEGIVNGEAGEGNYPPFGSLGEGPTVGVESILEAPIIQSLTDLTVLLFHSDVC